MNMNRLLDYNYAFAFSQTIGCFFFLIKREKKQQTSFPAALE